MPYDDAERPLLDTSEDIELDMQPPSPKREASPLEKLTTQQEKLNRHILTIKKLENAYSNHRWFLIKSGGGSLVCLLADVGIWVTLSVLHSKHVSRDKRQQRADFTKFLPYFTEPTFYNTTCNDILPVNVQLDGKKCRISAFDRDNWVWSHSLWSNEYYTHSSFATCERLIYAYEGLFYQTFAENAIRNQLPRNGEKTCKTMYPDIDVAPCETYDGLSPSEINELACDFYAFIFGYIMAQKGNCTSQSFLNAAPKYKDDYDKATIESFKDWFRLPKLNDLSNKTCKDIHPVDTLCIENYKARRNNPNTPLFCGQNAMSSCIPVSIETYSSSRLLDYNTYTKGRQSCFEQFGAADHVLNTYNQCQMQFEQNDRLPSSYCSAWNDRTGLIITLSGGGSAFILCILVLISAFKLFKRTKNNPLLSDLSPNGNQDLQPMLDTLNQSRQMTQKPDDQTAVDTFSSNDPQKATMMFKEEINNIEEIKEPHIRKMIFLLLISENMGRLKKHTSHLPPLPLDIWKKIGFFAGVVPEKPFDDTNPFQKLK